MLLGSTYSPEYHNNVWWVGCERFKGTDDTAMASRRLQTWFDEEKSERSKASRRRDLRRFVHRYESLQVRGRDG